MAVDISWVTDCPVCGADMNVAPRMFGKRTARCTECDLEIIMRGAVAVSAWQHNTHLGNEQRVVLLSTGHLTQEDSKILAKVARAVAGGGYYMESLEVYDTGFGYLLRMASDWKLPDAQASFRSIGLSESFCKILKQIGNEVTKRAGGWLEFDCDACEVPGLETFTW